MQTEREKLCEKDSLSFLLAEYEECYAQMRHYDNIIISLIKFVIAFYSLVMTISFGIIELITPDESNVGLLYVSLFLFIVGLFGFGIILVMVRNRLYFTLVTRQINILRKKLLSLTSIKFNNVLFTDSKIPVPYNRRSSHIILIKLIYMINSLFLAVSIYLLMDYFLDPSWQYKIFVFIISFIISILIGWRITYWKLQKKNGEGY